MKTINPFSDPEFKKSILRGEGIIDDNGESVEEIEYEILGEDASISSVTEQEGFESILNSAPKIPSQVKNIILDASQIAKNEKEARAIELNRNLNTVLTKYNKTYGLNLQVDLNSLSNTLVSCSDPQSRRTLELYLSEIFQSIRPVLILQMISKLSMTIEYLLDPKRLLDENNLNTADLFVVCEKLLDYIGKLEELRDEVVIKGSDLELQKIKDEAGGGSRDMTDEEKKTVEDFMSLFKKDSGL